MDIELAIQSAIIDNKDDTSKAAEAIKGIVATHQPHETHFMCLRDSIQACVEDKYLTELGLPLEQRVDLGKFLCGEINNFKMNALIATQKKETSQYIAKTKRDNIKTINQTKGATSWQ